MDRGRNIGGKYELIAPIGEGGMGVVWRARHLELEREVALKRLARGESSEVAIARFAREARSAAAVRSPNVVEVLDYGRDDEGEPYLVMELLRGESLAARLEREPPLSLEEALDYVDQALTGLCAIHDAGIVHRDLKPANLFLSQTNDESPVVVKVLDFGIARPAAPEASLTHTMQTLGTPHYMSPEQVRSTKSVDARSDVYSMGVILYQLATGRLPFDGPSASAVIAAIVADDPPPVRSLRPDLAPPIAQVIERAMTKDVRHRFADARALRDALRAARRGTVVGGAVRCGKASGPTVLDVAARRRGGAAAASRRNGPTKRILFALLGMGGVVSALGLAVGAVVQGTDREELATHPAGRPGTMRIGEPRSLVAAALAWRGLPVATRDAVALARSGERWALVATDPTHAGSVADSLGVALHADLELPPEARWLRPKLFRTNARSNVREGPTQDAALRGTLMEGALVVGFLGEVEDSASGADPNVGWIRVVASSLLDGWIARRLLEDEPHCSPVVSADEVPVKVTIRDERGTEQDAAIGVDVRGALHLYGIDRDCALVLRGTARTQGAIADAFLTSTGPRGESIILIGEWRAARPTADGFQLWTARPGSDLGRVVWSQELRSGQNLPDDRREGLGGPFSRGPNGEEGFFPIRIRRARNREFFVWNETQGTFVPFGSRRAR